MTDVDELREEYVDARADVRRAEADRSQLLTALSHVEAAFDAARRGDEGEETADALSDLAAEAAGWAYDRAELDRAGLLAERPTFETFGVERPADLVDPLTRYYDRGAREQFEDLVACLLDAIEGGGEPFDPLADVVADVAAAFEERDREDFERGTERLVDGFRERDVRTGGDLRELLEAERGALPGEHLLSLQTDANDRDDAIEDLETAVDAGDAEAFVDARRPFDRAATALDAFARSSRNRLAGVTGALTDEYPADHATPHPGLDSETPVLLTPTRLETRFVRRRDENGEPVTDPPKHELLVRVYPDDVHVDTHERALTDAEIEHGARFWERVWWASHRDDAGTLADELPDSMLDDVDLAEFPADPEARHAAIKERAWNALEERFGADRAAWVKRAMAPADSVAMLAGPPAMGYLEDGDVAAFEAEMDGLRDEVDRRPGAWTRPPRARLLPDQWIAFAETDGGERTATSGPVERPLSIGPDPGSLESATETAAEHDDFRAGEMEWVFDFDAAEDVGMALRIPLTEAEASAGVDRLTVLGVSTGLDGTEAADEVADLLDAHRYTDGLSVLERGTPTNDTREDAAATAPSGDVSRYERECTLPAVSPGDADADGVRAAELLGVDPDVVGTDRPFVFDRVPGADRSLDATAAATNAALWSATWGYVVPHLLVPDDWAETVFRRKTLVQWLEDYRRHFVGYVRAGGPIPPLRVGDQPYGIVPTTDYGSWSPVPDLATAPETDVPDTAGHFPYERFPDRDVSEHLAGLLDELRPVWTDAVDAVPRVDSADDPEIVASDLLSMAGTSYGYRLREFVGSEAAAAVSDEPIPRDDFRRARAASADQLETAAGVQRTPRVGDLLAKQEEDGAPPIHAAVVDGDLSSSLQALRTTRHDGLRTGPPGADFDLEDLRGTRTWLWPLFVGGPDQSLAEALCYHAILQEYRLARVRIGHHYGNWAERLEAGAPWDRAPWSLLPEPQVYEEGDRTMWDALEDDVPDALQDHPAFVPDWTVGDFLRHVPAVDRPFAELVDGFETLEDADPAVVERAIRETLDLTSHRYDAWATSLATRRLDGMRETGADGLYVGAYGYVEDLEKEGPLDDAENDQSHRTKGYVQAPSIDQATAASVLRSAHDAEREEYGDLFAVDLSADRVREARILLEGVRNGFSLGELLGARFERGLHENHPGVELDQYVYAFRSLAPLVEGRIDREDAEASDDAAEREVVDGAALYELWRNDAIPWGQQVGAAAVDPLPPTDEGNPAYVAIREELEAVETAFDSVSDVLAAESVYQLVRDNPERAGAALDALSRGEAVGDVEVTETPRTGTSCTHRLLALLDPDAARSAWAPGESPRAAAEPALDDWVSELMGDPTRVVCRVAYETESGDGDGSGGDGDPDDGDAGDAEESDWRVVALRLSQLDVSALDVVSLLEGDESAWGSELEARIEYHVRRTREDVGSSGELRLSFAPPADWPDAEALGVDPAAAVGFGELLEVAGAVRSVVSDARPVDARDVTVPGEADGAGQVVGDLDARAGDAFDRFSTAVDDLEPQVGALAADPETDERVVDDLVALVDAVRGLPADGLTDVRDALGAVDGTGLHDDLQSVAAAISGQDDVHVVLRPDEPGFEDQTEPGATVTVRLSAPGQFLLTRTVTADDEGRFRAEFDLDELDHGTEFTITVRRDGQDVATYDGRYHEEPPLQRLSLPALQQFATVVETLDGIVSSAQPVADAAAALDDEAVDAAVARFDDADWSRQAEADLAAVREIPSATLPGFSSLSHWETVAVVARAVGDDDLDAGDVSEAGLDGSVPSATELDRLRRALAMGVDAVDDGIAAADRRPDEDWIAAALETIRGALLVCADYGVQGSVPLSATGTDRSDLESLARQADSVHEEVVETRATAKDHCNRGDAEDDPEAYVACLEALFGEAFTVLVPFEPTNAGELSSALDPAHGRSLQNDDPLAVERWFDRIGRVRDEASRFGRALTYGETLGARSPADGARFRVGQLPYEADDTWVGLSDAWTDDHPPGRLSLVADVRGSQPGDRYVGLFVDEHVETVPNEEETTGLSVHYDRPTNQAPQSMLLAVPPTDEDWSVETLADVVRESVELAKLRTVDRDALGDLGHLLPGLAFATNESADPAGPDTASVDPGDLMADWWALDGFGGGA